MLHSQWILIEKVVLGALWKGLWGSTSMTRIPSLPQKRKGLKAIPVSIVPGPVLGTSRWLVYCSSWNTKPRGIDDSGWKTEEVSVDDGVPSTKTEARNKAFASRWWVCILQLLRNCWTSQTHLGSIHVWPVSVDISHWCSHFCLDNNCWYLLMLCSQKQE